MKNDGIGFFLKVSKQRLWDAKALLATEKTERERGSLYICGYSVECMLKAILIARAPAPSTTLTQAEDAYRANNANFPELSTKRGHDLELLFELCASEGSVEFSPDETSLFGVAKKWQHVWRYQSQRPKPGFAQNFVAAAERLVNSIERHC